MIYKWIRNKFLLVNIVRRLFRYYSYRIVCQRYKIFIEKKLILIETSRMLSRTCICMPCEMNKQCVSSCERNLGVTFFSFMRYAWNFWRGLYLLTENKIVGWQIAYSNIHVKASSRTYMFASVYKYRVIPVPSHEADMVCSLPHTYFAMPLILCTIAMQSPLYRFISTLSSRLNLRCLLFYVFSPLLTYIRLTNTLKKCAGGRLSACSHSTSVGRRLPESKELMPIRRER